mmetsp:Transcript_5057/g.22809  ORF Transcript_5057/g.22809 Transcript_5057/m.22809 type:complete len:288 (+) Transcript_5057:130-993(+)
MAPTLTATPVGRTGRSGNRSFDSAHVATTELRVVSGSCGRPARVIPLVHSSELGHGPKDGTAGPMRNAPRLPGRHAAMSTPSATRTSATCAFDPPFRADSGVVVDGVSLGEVTRLVGAVIAAKTNASASAPSAMPSTPHHPRIVSLLPSVHTASVHPLAHSNIPSPSCIPRTTPNGVTWLNRSMSPVLPRMRTTSATNPPAATICGTPIGGSVIATAAMVFIGCSGIGTSNTSAVARLYNPVNTKVVPTSRPHVTVRPTNSGTKVPRSPRDPPASRHVKSRRSSAAL